MMAELIDNHIDVKGHGNILFCQNFFRAAVEKSAFVIHHKSLVGDRHGVGRIVRVHDCADAVLVGEPVDHVAVSYTHLIPQRGNDTVEEKRTNLRPPVSDGTWIEETMISQERCRILLPGGGVCISVSYTHLRL